LINNNKEDVIMTNEDKKHNSEESQYEKLAHKTAELLDSLKEKTPETVEKIVEKAKKELVDAGEIGSKKAEEFAKYLKKDLRFTKDDLSKLGDTIKDKSHPSRVGAGILNVFHDIAKVVGTQLTSLADKTEDMLTFKTGGMTGPSTLTCTKCGKEIHLTKTARIPPCSGCKAASTFKKSY